MKTTTQTVAANVRAEMARRGVRQAEVAALLGVTQTAVSRRLLGRTPFNVDELSAVAEHLGVPVSGLLGERPLTAA